MAIFEPQTLMYFYHKGFSNVDAISGYVKKWPDRLVMGSRWDPRDGEAGEGPLGGKGEKIPLPPLPKRKGEAFNAAGEGGEGGGVPRGGARFSPTVQILVEKT